MMRHGKAVAISSALSVAGLASAASAATIAKFDFDSIGVDNKTISNISGSATNFDAVYNRTVTLDDADPFTNANSKSVVETTQGGTSTTNTVALVNNPGSISLATNNGFTIEGWVNLSSLPSGKNAYLVEMTASGTDIFLGVNTGGQAYVRFYSNNGTNYLLTGTTTLSTGQWTHLAFTYVNGGTAATSPGTLYVNGVSEASFTYNRGLPTALTGVYIGGNSSSAGTYGSPYGGITGKIDDVLIADTKYTQAQVQYDMAHSFTVPEPSSMALLVVSGLLLGRRRRA